MNRKLALMMMILICTAFAYGQNQLAGYKYDSVAPDTILPNGWKSLGGSLIGDFTKDPIWSLGRVSKGRTQMIWMERAVSKDAKGSVEEWEVIATLSFPNFSAGHDLLAGGGPAPCTVKGKLADDLVVHVQFLERTQTYRTIKAWRADIEGEKFVPVNAREVKCTFEAP